jgi:DNA-binding response OmpR family regulator
LLSGYLAKTAILAVNESGADELSVKPVSPKALYQHVSRIVLQEPGEPADGIRAKSAATRRVPQEKSRRLGAPVAPRRATS